MLSGMEENKKSGGGDVRAKAPSWDIAARKKSRFAEKKSASPKKNYAYSLQDSIVYGDSCSWGMQWVEPPVRRDAPLHLMRCLIVRCAGITWRRHVPTFHTML